MAASKNFVLTDHARQRMKLRRITEAMVTQALSKPQEKVNEADGDIKFIRTISQREVHVVAYYLDDERKWLVKSVWVRGEDDPKPLWWQMLTLIPRLVRRLFNPR
jgi:hypothetical protein